MSVYNTRPSISVECMSQSMLILQATHDFTEMIANMAQSLLEVEGAEQVSTFVLCAHTQFAASGVHAACRLQQQKPSQESWWTLK